MNKVGVKTRKIDTVFVVVFAEIMKSKVSARERARALDTLNQLIKDSLATRRFKEDRNGK